MIPNETDRTLTTNGVAATAMFSLSIKDSVHLMGILRDTLYSDKVLAVLREYGANAWDAHRTSGKAEVPIQITMPTYDEPMLKIRDFGVGLSHDDVFEVYTKYGASTKRSDDDSVGMLGIGSKSGFAYSDTFTVTSWHGEAYADDFIGPRCNYKRIYAAVLDESNAGSMNLLHEEPCAADETGVEIQIAVRNEDIGEFDKTAKKLFQYFHPRPTINIELPPLPKEHTVLKHGSIKPGGYGDWIAVMGCVPYRINLDKVVTTQSFLRSISGTLSFNIGDVHIAASREELKYSQATKDAIVQKFDDLIDEFVEHSLTSIESSAVTPWEARLRVRVLAAMKLPIPEEWEARAEGMAKVEYAGQAFSIILGSSHTTRISVLGHTRLLIDDTGNALVGYNLGQDDYVVRPQHGVTDGFLAALAVCLEASGLTGIPQVKLSTLHWTPPYVKPKRVSNPKHRAKMFQLVPNEEGSFSAPFSDYWEVVTRVPTLGDVWVLVEGFKGRGDFFARYKADAEFAEAFGLEMPTVYGYKTTEKRPVDITQIDGTEYSEWRKTLGAKALTPELLKLIDVMHWSNVAEERYANAPEEKALKKLAKQLGDQHAIVELFTKHQAAYKELYAALKANDNMPEGSLDNLANRTGNTFELSAAKQALDLVADRYPLLKLNRLKQLWDTDYDYANGGYVESPASKLWREYVKLVDRDIARSSNTNNVVALKSVP